MSLTDAQRAAVKFYEGDVCGSDPFWGDAKAYVTLNSLFYPGIDTERRRAAEGKRLNPAITSDTERLLRVCIDLLQACKAADISKPRCAYRVERHADYLEMRRAGKTISFTSTSTEGFLAEYGDRIGIALLEFHIPAGIACLPFAEVLEADYAKSDEQEILLPPGLSLSFSEMELTDQERSIIDAQGNSPVVKCLVNVGESRFAPVRDSERSQEAEPSPEGQGPASVFDNAGPLASACIYEALNSGREPDPADVLRYNAWKRAFQAEVFRCAGW